MIGFYHGIAVPANSEPEGIYFIKETNQPAAIYIKLNNKDSAVKYAELNEVDSALLEEYVKKTLTIANLPLTNNITKDDLISALELKSLAFKSQASGELTDYVTGVNDISYTPSGEVSATLAYTSTDIQSQGSTTAKGSVSGSVVSKGSVEIHDAEDGYQIQGTVSAPVIRLTPKTKKVRGIKSAGTLATYTPAVYTEPSLTSTPAEFTTEGVTTFYDGNNTLVFNSANKGNAISTINFNSGSYTEAEYIQGSLPEMEDSEVEVLTEISAQADAPTFTGNSIGAVFTGETSNISATFVGQESNVIVSGKYDKAEVDSVAFEGTPSTIQPQLTKNTKSVTVS